MIVQRTLLVMPTCVQTAGDFCKRGGTPVPQVIVKKMKVQLMSALQHIHKQGYSFCDLKPDNIFMTWEGMLFDVFVWMLETYSFLNLFLRKLGTWRLRRTDRAWQCCQRNHTPIYPPGLAYGSATGEEDLRLYVDFYFHP